ncbi:cyclic-di-AMP receptor [Alkaliphilus oremlandii]|uniref:Nitrogen regulatory protein P-II n=1 Tax=Alkaliphilus oremlandii (strain OhILAs) TaxID=350688 RepID=A8MEG0_ALKOO|nr:cyclic-di-AMP receptor [Alkaliphilus oremlandii]ABW17631.1 protein of unknown function DUF970 [Alkaliphilus oremlandii OhILAs]
MKLIIAIVNDEDVHHLIEDLTKSKFMVTKLATTGGFLKSGNTTLLIGVDDEKVDQVIGIIKDNCETRKQTITSTTPISGAAGVFIPYPVEVRVGGATIFVVDIEKHVKL